MQEMTMVERVARAISRKNTGSGINWPDFTVEARAAIEAMKRPITDAMIDAGNHSKDNGQNISEIFDDMIDAALSE